jgi:hypothetical protein
VKFAATNRRSMPRLAYGAANRGAMLKTWEDMERLCDGYGWMRELTVETEGAEQGAGATGSCDTLWSSLRFIMSWFQERKAVSSPSISLVVSIPFKS